MLILIYEEGRVKCMDNKTANIISEDVIDECLADSIEKSKK